MKKVYELVTEMEGKIHRKTNRWLK